MDSLHKIKCDKTGMSKPMISDFHHTIIMENADKLNSAIIYDRDFSYNYFGFKVPCFEIIFRTICEGKENYYM